MELNQMLRVYKVSTTERKLNVLVEIIKESSYQSLEKSTFGKNHQHFTNYV